MALPGPWPLLTSLQACLCAEIADLPETCFCGILPGAFAVDDYGPGGQAWVRLVTAFPSIAFPTAATGPEATAVAPLAYQIEVGVWRCAPMIDDQGNLPTVAEQDAAAELQMEDMMAIRRAIVCCLGEDDDYEYRLGQYIPAGPTQSVGGAWTVWVRRL